MKTYQSGTTTVEFAIIGALFFMVLFGVIEFGRLLFAWNTLTEATRRGARVAAVCPPNHSAIANMAVFNTPTTSGDSAVLSGLNTSQVFVEYLAANGACITEFTPDTGTDHCESFNTGIPIRYVRVLIDGYTHTLIIPIIPGLSTPRPLPSVFETTLPAESLGVVPGVGSQCFGTAS